MWILEIITTHKLIFGIIGGILLLNIGVIIYLVLKDHKLDKQEIEELEQIEPNKTDEDLMDKKVSKNQADLEKLLVKMQKDLETKTEDVVEHFESEQEEKSIISYQELVNSVNVEKEAIKNDYEVTVTKVELPETKEPKIRQAIKKFKNSEFISPIYGKQKTQVDYPKIEEFNHDSKTMDNFLDEEFRESNTTIEENIDVNPLSEEIKQNEDFLASLKEFRRNL